MTNVQKKGGFREWMRDISTLFTVIGALLVLIVFFALSSPYFMSVRNFLNIGLYAAIVGCISCSVTFVNISGMIDISVGSQIAVAAMVCAVTSRTGASWPVTVLAGLAAGTLCGAINGFFVTVFKLNAFITTIATMQTLRGVAYLISDGQSLPISDRSFTFIGRGYVLGIPLSLLIMIIAYIVFHIISRRTSFGRQVYMIGGNAQAASPSSTTCAAVSVRRRTGSRGSAIRSYSSMTASEMSFAEDVCRASRAEPCAGLGVRRP